MNSALPKDLLNFLAGGSSVADWPKTSGHNHRVQLSTLSQGTETSAGDQVVEDLEGVVVECSQEVHGVAGLNFAVQVVGSRIDSVRSVAELLAAILADFDLGVGKSLDHRVPVTEMPAFVLDKIRISCEIAGDGKIQLKGCYMMGWSSVLAGVVETMAIDTARRN
jgi:hypothetical protein